MSVLGDPVVAVILVLIVGSIGLAVLYNLWQ